MCLSFFLDWSIRREVLKDDAQVVTQPFLHLHEGSDRSVVIVPSVHWSMLVLSYFEVRHVVPVCLTRAFMSFLSRSLRLIGFRGTSIYLNDIRDLSPPTSVHFFFLQDFGSPSRIRPYSYRSSIGVTRQSGLLPFCLFNVSSPPFLVYHGNFWSNSSNLLFLPLSRWVPKVSKFVVLVLTRIPTTQNVILCFTCSSRFSSFYPVNPFFTPPGPDPTIGPTSPTSFMKCFYFRQIESVTEYMYPLLSFYLVSLSVSRHKRIDRLSLLWLYFVVNTLLSL